MSIAVENVVKRYRATLAVDGVSFTVPEGSIFGLLGANGAGKTSIVRMLLNITRPDAGKIGWRGTPTANLPRRWFGYLPEERGLYPSMAVDEQLRFFARIRGVDRKAVEVGIEYWLGRLGMSEHRRNRTEQLSKGNQQKIQFLTAVLHEPPVLILDEPFSGLDPVSTELLKAVLVELRSKGTTCVLSTHDMEQAEELCDGVALMHRSKLVFSGPLRQIRRRYTSKKTLQLGFDGEISSLLATLPGVRIVGERQGILELMLPDSTTPQEVLVQALKLGRVRSFQEAEPSLRRIFIDEVGGKREDRTAEVIGV